MNSLPIIDLSPFTNGTATHEDKEKLAEHLGDVCNDIGFFYVVNHGVPEVTQEAILDECKEFFTHDGEEKKKISMELSGKAMRGWVPLGGELTSARPDQKEALYFGRELDENHPKVIKHTPLHGPNLFPDNQPKMKPAVLEYIEAMLRLGTVILEALDMTFDLEPEYLKNHFITDPYFYLAVIHYPPRPAAENGESWGVGAHTDAGLITILKQDDVGGLQVLTRQNEWIDAAPIPNSFVVNIGDMLERITGGVFRSTTHRVKNKSTTKDRYSVPFFFNPNWSTRINKIKFKGKWKDMEQSDEYKQKIAKESSEEFRWDHFNIHEKKSLTYGDYIVSKISKIFPQVFARPDQSPLISNTTPTASPAVFPTKVGAY